MTAKIDKLRDDLQKSTQKLNRLQGHIKLLQTELLRLENTEIIGLVREIGLTPEQLADLLEQHKDSIPIVTRHRKETEELTSDEAP